jgi:hypothetical protein
MESDLYHYMSCRYRTINHLQKRDCQTTRRGEVTETILIDDTHLYTDAYP